MVLNEHPDIYRKWVDRLLRETASASGFEVIRRMALLPPIGAGIEYHSDEAQAIAKITDVPEFTAYLKTGNSLFWRSWLQFARGKAEVSEASLSLEKRSDTTTGSERTTA